MSRSYKYKYNKYKSKYLKLIGQLGGAMGSERKIKPLEDRIEDPYDNSVGYINIAKTIPQTDRIPDSSEIDFQNDEIFYKLKKLKNVSSRELTKNMKSNKFTILQIDDTNIFDKFTNKYGSLEDGSIKIDWSTVADDFAGLYLSPKKNLKRDRFDKAIYKNKKYDSWWEDEWDTDDVVVFTKSDVTHIPALLPDNISPLDTSESYNS